MVETPQDLKHMDTKWVFKTKEDESGNIIKLKARWVVKRYIQVQGIDNALTHAPVSRMSTMHTILSLALNLKLNVHQMDVSTAFFNAPLDDEVMFVNPPPGYEILVPPGKSLRLVKALYGLKQESRMWNLTLDSFFKNHCRITTSVAETFLYTRCDNDELELIIMIYVHEILLISKD